MIVRNRSTASVRLVALIVTLTLKVVCSAPAAWGETIPKTFHGAGEAFADGGRQIGEGFRGIGRGVKNTFTGQRSGPEYKKGAAIGTGFKDLGIGIAGSGRALGRTIKKGFTDGD